MIKKLPLPLLSLLFVLGYLALNKEALYPLVQRVPPVPQSISLYKQEVLNKSNKYAATNIFDKGYVREESSKLRERLTLSPEGNSLEKRCFVIPNNSSENIIKITLPEGFRHGILNSNIKADSEYSIGISSDLKSWEFNNYPGYSEWLKNTVALEKSLLSDEVVYLKFIPKKNETLNVCFDEFQYTSNLPSDVVDYSNYLLFPPDMDVDDDGEIIYQAGVRWQNH